MMLRLLATHPRMTRKGFGRITVHFLKEVCRALYIDSILVYTYPSSAPFYKALHFRHTYQQQIAQARPAMPEAGAAARDREASREARRVFSAKENEMVFFVQSSMAHLLGDVARRSYDAAHPYACTRRRSAPSVPQSSHEPRHEIQTQETIATAAEAPIAVAASAGEGTGSCAKASRGRGKKSSASVSGEVSGANVPQNGAGDHLSARKLLLESVASLYTPRAAPLAASSATVNDAHVPARAAPEGRVVVLADESRRVSNSITATSSVSPRKRPRLNNEYHVEKIVDVQRSRTNPADVKYLIKWKGWPAKYNTWEPLGHLHNLRREIEAFESSRRCATGSLN